MPSRRTKNKLTPALDESGSVVVVLAITFAVLCGFVALVVDVGHMIIVKAELQRTADAAVLAGVAGFLPYNNPGPNQTPNWANGVTQAHNMINNQFNQADNQRFTLTDGTVAYGYWLLNPPNGYAQTLPIARPTTAAYLPEPAITVALSRSVNLYFAPLILISSPQKVSATAIAILPEAYQTTGLPPVAVSWDTVYNIVGGAVQIDLVEQNIKPQSNKGIAGWFNLNGGNSVTSVSNNVFTSGTGTGTTPIYLVPGTKATLTDYITVGQTIVMPVVQDVSQKASLAILGWTAFQVDTLGANSMTGHFLPQYFDPHVVPTPAGSGTIGGVAGTPKLVSP